MIPHRSCRYWRSGLQAAGTDLFHRHAHGDGVPAAELAVMVRTGRLHDPLKKFITKQTPAKRGFLQPLG